MAKEGSNYVGSDLDTSNNRKSHPKKDEDYIDGRLEVLKEERNNLVDDEDQTYAEGRRDCIDKEITDLLSESE